MAFLVSKLDWFRLCYVNINNIVTRVFKIINSVKILFKWLICVFRSSKFRGHTHVSLIMI